MLFGLIKDIFSARKSVPNHEIFGFSKRVLNVGGGSKSTAISKHFDGWQHELLDIDPRGKPDIVCDARELIDLKGNIYDAIYCSHNLEHYYRHDGIKVLRGFLKMLNENGFAEIRVPDIALVISTLLEKQLELDDVLYQSLAGPITAHDVIYGLQSEIENTGQDFYAHKTGFTSKSLVKMLEDCGFEQVFLINDEALAVHALAFKVPPTSEQIALLGLKPRNT
jgi:hypothetical protein